MKELVLARHGESEYSLQQLVNGDPGVACPLTEAGREQARALGRALAGEPVDLCAVTSFARTRETAELALAGRDVPVVVVAELNDPRVGELEGRTLAEYREWAWAKGPLERPPGGGESRGELAARYARGLRALLARPEGTVLCIAHALPVAYALDASRGLSPSQRARPIEYATPYRLSSVEVERAAALLEGWARSPAF